MTAKLKSDSGVPPLPCRRQSRDGSATLTPAVPRCHSERSEESQPLPRGWTWTTLGEVSDPSVEQGGPKGQGQFVYVDISSIDNEAKRIASPKRVPASEAPSRARQRLKPGDVLVSMTRPNLNAVAMLPAEMTGAIGSSGFHVLRAASADPGWLFYAVQTNDFVEEMSGVVQGTLYPAVRPKDIRAYPIPLPPLPEQRRIVAEIEKQFTWLEAGVAALRRAQANLKRYRASVLKAACEGRLAPTEAELQRSEVRAQKSDAGYETGEQLLQRILKERRQKWAGKGKYKEPAAPDTANLPTLAEGWCWATVEQLSLALQYGYTASAEHRQEGPRFLRITDIQDGRVDWDSVPSCEIVREDTAKYRLDSGDLVFARTGATTGKSYVIRESPDAVFASYLIRLRTAPAVLPSYVYTFFQSAGYWRQIEAGKRGIGQPNVNARTLSRINAPLPPLGEQERIVAEVERRLSVVEGLGGGGSEPVARGAPAPGDPPARVHGPPRAPRPQRRTRERAAGTPTGRPPG